MATPLRPSPAPGTAGSRSPRLAHTLGVLAVALLAWLAWLGYRQPELLLGFANFRLC